MPRRRVASAVSIQGLQGAVCVQGSEVLSIRMDPVASQTSRSMLSAAVGGEGACRRVAHEISLRLEFLSLCDGNRGGECRMLEADANVCWAFRVFGLL